MATTLNTSWTLLNTRTWYASNAPGDFTTRLYARIRSGSIGEGSGSIVWRYTYQPSFNFSGTFGNGGGNYRYDGINGGPTNVGTVGGSNNAEVDIVQWDSSFSGASSGREVYGYAYTVYNWGAATQSNSQVSGTVLAPSQPYGLGCNNIVPGVESFTANVYISGWGGLGDSSNRYRELQVWTYNASSLVEPRRWQHALGNSTSGTITCSNSSSTSSSPLTITGNTRYTIGAYSSNGTYATVSHRIGDAVTLAYAPTISFSSATANAITLNYSQPADGGYYTKTIQYSLDGNTWTNAATVSSSSASTGTFTISGLSANTTYNIRSRVTTTAGTTTGNTVSAATVGPNVPTLAVNGQGTTSNYIAYGVSSFNEGTDPHIYLYRDTFSPPTTTIRSETTTGTKYTIDSGLTSNTLYYYRAGAVATYDGTTAWSYSDVKSRLTYAAAPTIDYSQEYSTYNKVSITVKVIAPASGSDFSRETAYRYKVGDGAYTSWATLGTMPKGDGSSATYTVQLTDISTDSTVTVEARTSNRYTSANSYRTATISTLSTHTGPTGFNWTPFDNNSIVQNWLANIPKTETSLILLNGLSRLGARVTSAGTPSDDASLVSYTFSFPTDSKSISVPYSTGTISGLFSDPTPSSYSSLVGVGSVVVRGSVYDSLGAQRNLDAYVMVGMYEEPTLEADVERLNEQGNILLNIQGVYSSLALGSTVNSGKDNNSAKYYYRVLAYDGTVAEDWTEITNVTVENDTETSYRRLFTGNITLKGITFLESFTVEAKVEDAFSSVPASVPVDVWDGNRVLYPPEYDVELWDWKANTFVADISNLIDGDLNIEWTLNDVEQVSFDMDLLQFEKKCEEMGLDPNNLLKPYVHDIRIRRNGSYIVGCQLVEVTIKVTNNPPVKISVKGTGFLNLFKDQYIMQEVWGSFAYSQIARRLVESAQKPDSLLKNPTCDVDVSYWLAYNGTVAYHTGTKARGDGCLICSASSSGTSVVAGSQMTNIVGQSIAGNLYVYAPSGVSFTIEERQYITDYGTKYVIGTFTGTGGWQHIEFSNFTTHYENAYFCVSCSQNPIYIDEAYIRLASDEPTLCNLNVTLGADTASSQQSSDRVVNYSLQNVKDALMELTEMEDDNFDFEFLPDRTFNIYAQKGSEKLDLEISYPGNIDSMTISRSASNLANKIYNIGSGIGDERMQVLAANSASRSNYGTREAILTNSNVDLTSTLTAQVNGELRDRKEPTNLPTITIKDGSVNPSNLQTGDIILPIVEEDAFLGTINDGYRVMKISCSVSENAVETMKITLEEYL